MTYRWGIDDSYEDASGRMQTIPREVLERVRGLVGEPPEEDAAHVQFVHAGDGATSVGRGMLELEDGSTLAVDGPLPPDVPLGYHRLVTDAATEATVNALPVWSACRLAGGVRCDLGCVRAARRHRRVSGRRQPRDPGQRAYAIAISHGHRGGGR